MTEKEINAIIEKTSLQNYEGILEKIQYVMEFGEISIQYDFCLN